MDVVEWVGSGSVADRDSTHRCPMGGGVMQWDSCVTDVVGTE